MFKTRYLGFNKFNMRKKLNDSSEKTFIGWLIYLRYADSMEVFENIDRELRQLYVSKWNV